MIQNSVNQMLGTISSSIFASSFVKGQMQKNKEVKAPSMEEQIQNKQNDIINKSIDKAINTEMEQRAMQNIREQAMSEQSRIERVFKGFDVVKNKNANLQEHYQRQFEQRKEVK